MEARTTTLTIAALLALTALAPAMGTAQTNNGEGFHFVTFELGEVIAKDRIDATLDATFASETTSTHVSGLPGEALRASLSLPVTSDANEHWSVNLSTTAGEPLLQARGTLSSEGIQIHGSHVDSDRLDLPRDTTSLRVLKGYVSATISLVAQLAQADCCTATLGIDGNADGNITGDEKRTVPAAGDTVEASVHLERAAPSVDYVFSITNQAGTTVARASGTYSFAQLNGISADGEFDPAYVEHVTGTVDREPHVTEHAIGSSILLQTVSGSNKDADGPTVFFTMGTPEDPAPADENGSENQTVTAAPSSTGPSMGEQVMELITGPVFLAVVIGSFTAAVLAFTVRRVMERAG